MYRLLIAVILLSVFVPVVQADSGDEIADIKKTAIDYMESWYQGDTKRMKASLHKNLAKRSLRSFPSGKKDLRHTKRSEMVMYTGGGYGERLWSEDHNIEVIVLDHYRNIATVKVITPDYYEYLHLAKMHAKEDKWVIINAIYETNLNLGD